MLPNGPTQVSPLFLGILLKVRVGSEVENTDLRLVFYPQFPQTLSLVYRMRLISTEQNVSFIVVEIDNQVHRFGAVCMRVHLNGVVDHIPVGPKCSGSVDSIDHLQKELVGRGGLQVYGVNHMILDVTVGKGLDDSHRDESIGGRSDVGG